MEWRLFGQIAESAGASAVAIDPDAVETVGDALEALFDRHPDLRATTMADGDLRPHVSLLVDGENVGQADGEIPIEEDTELALLPPMTGG
ncbi:MAG: ubiquitin-like small modifier protein 1 [Halococcoides sp.]